MKPPSDLCENCGEPLNEDGTKHYNDITFCAFVTPQIRWHDWRTARSGKRIHEHRKRVK